MEDTTYGNECSTLLLFLYQPDPDSEGNDPIANDLLISSPALPLDAKPFQYESLAYAQAECRSRHFSLEHSNSASERCTASPPQHGPITPPDRTSNLPSGTDCEANAFHCSDPTCGKSFKSKRHLANHVRRHTRPVSCTFEGCQRRFADQKDADRHASKLHKSAESIIVCPAPGCGKVFTGRLDALLRHVRGKRHLARHGRISFSSRTRCSAGHTKREDINPARINQLCPNSATTC